MFCSKCGNKLDANSKFCSKCGSQNIGYSPPNTVNVSTNNTTNITVNTNKKRVNYLKIIIPILVVVLVIGFSVFATLKGKNHTRTVMIYMVGSNLESDAGLGTVDLSSVDYNRMDHEHVNVVLNRRTQRARLVGQSRTAGSFTSVETQEIRYIISNRTEPN